MNLDISCKGINNVSWESGGTMSVELSNVSPDFIEQLEIRDIMMWADQQKLMNEFDYDELIEFFLTKYDVKIVSNLSV